ncbi:ankyrin repeat domain-containing protein [Treponema sp.]|uniref:ankyrin repeat domain-containing protein n=1 Tax=Treponema sp. TaxID=166 RepID=UPI00298E0292|nr:ankyrin repeat domain-containing protein [Treponema sp.]MCR5613309.1 ankyrin repeat domain-containing protein [Treponema sp.]
MKKFAALFFMIFLSAFCYAERDTGIWKFEDRIAKCDKTVIKDIEKDLDNFEEHADEWYSTEVPYRQFYFWVYDDNDNSIIKKYLKAGNVKVVDFLISNFEYYQGIEYIEDACESGNKQIIDYIFNYDDKHYGYSKYDAGKLCNKFGNTTNPVVLNAVARYCSKTLIKYNEASTFYDFIEAYKDIFEYAVKNKIFDANVVIDDEPCLCLLMYGPKRFKPQERIKLMKLLLDAGADINVIRDFKRNALFDAAEDNLEYIARFLIENGIDVTLQDESGETPLFVALRKENIGIAYMLIETGKGLNVISKDGYTPLSYVIYLDGQAFEVVAEKLIDAGADVNINGKGVHTALCEACDLNNFYLVKLLVEHGADVNLGSYNQKFYPLGEAVRHNNYEMVKYLIEHGAKVNVKNSIGTTEMFEIYAVSDTRIMDLLLEKGADINSRNNNGETPLFYAYILEDDACKIAEMLIKYGADINALNNNNETVLFEAFRTPELVDFYIKKGVDISVVNKDGLTAYDYYLRKTAFSRDKKRKSEKDKAYEKSVKILKKAMDKKK